MSNREAWWQQAGDRARGAWEKKRCDLVAKRKQQQEEIAPVLRSMRWRKIAAGRSRIENIDTFLKYYEMYTPLLAEKKDALVNARDSGLYQGFELFASAGMVAVLGVSPDGSRTAIAVVTDTYWEDSFVFEPHNYTPW